MEERGNERPKEKAEQLAFGVYAVWIWTDWLGNGDGCVK
jgi:hypothetical protein